MMCCLLLKKPLPYSRILTGVTFYVLSKFLQSMVSLYSFLIRKMKRNIMGIFVPRCYGKFQHVTHLLTHLSILRKCLQDYFLLACTGKKIFTCSFREVVTHRKQVQDIWSFSTHCPPHAQTRETQGSSSVLLGIKSTRALVIAALLASCLQEHWLWESSFDSTLAPTGRETFCKPPWTVCPSAG